MIESIQFGLKKKKFVSNVSLNFKKEIKKTMSNNMDPNNKGNTVLMR